MNYIKLFRQRKEEEYNAVRKSREIYDQIFMKFYSPPQKCALRGPCSETKCSGWKAFWVRTWTYHSGVTDYEYWEACSHRKHHGLEERKKDMLIRDIERAEERLFDWDAYKYKQKLEQERRMKEELKQQVLKQSDVLRGLQQKVY